MRKNITNNLKKRRRGFTLKTYKIPVSWEVYAIQEVKAESLEKAIEIFDNNNHHWALPDNEQYLDDSFKRGDLEECKKLNNL